MSQELLEILRCPNCVRNGPDAGLLDHEGNWLICRDCDLKYPIRDGIPVMLVEEGERFKGIQRQELPESPPPEKREVLPTDTSDAWGERQKLALALIGLAVGIGAAVLLMTWIKKKKA